MKMSYWRFAAMIATSTVIMLVLMYLNTYAWEHVFWSETRAWMALLMGSVMAVIMLSFMLSMYPNGKLNIGIYCGSVVVFLLTLWLVRSQTTVDGTSYMKAMIPHHSIAILTSERANISDHRVKKLADEIIEAQRREISEMKYLIQAHAARESAPLTAVTRSPKVMSAADAINKPDIATIDPTTLAEPEIRKVLTSETRCDFMYTYEGKPIFSVAINENGKVQGVMKIHGVLVSLTSTTIDSFKSLRNGGQFYAAPIQFTVQRSTEASEGDQSAIAHFRINDQLNVGYKGFYRCNKQ